jgi:hypothetical protein
VVTVVAAMSPRFPVAADVKRYDSWWVVTEKVSGGRVNAPEASVVAIGLQTFSW